MPLYISNSNSRIPIKKPGRFLLLSLFFLLSLFISSEMLIREMGFRPNISDSNMYWAIKRYLLTAENKKKNFVIIGASRSLVGIDPYIIKKRIPNVKVTHLSIDGTPPLYVLRDLSNDPNFNGIILLDLTIRDFLPDAILAAKPVIDFYHSNFNFVGTHLSEKLTTLIRVHLQNNLALLSPEFNVKRVAYTLLSIKGIKPVYAAMQLNRFRPAHYRTLMSDHDLSIHRNRRVQIVKNFSSQLQFDTILFRKALSEHLDAPYRKLTAKGANLILLRMPTTDEHWALDNSIFPKKQYWDLIHDTTAIPAIHFKDYDSLSSFECPDTSHLDATDTSLFTNALVDIIRPYL